MYSKEFDPELYKEKYRIKSIRLPHWDYSSDGWYFVTICTQNRAEYFGDVHDYIMELSDIGYVAAKFWQEIPKHFPFVRLDEWVTMPNHLHGIIVIDKPDNDEQDKNNYNPANRRDAINRVSTGNNANGGITGNHNPMGKQTLGEIVRWFKGRVSFEIHKTGQNFAWQSRFYDHIIQNQKSLDEIRQYIYDNPEKWGSDRNNSENLWM
jgi:putative transposase